MTKQSVLEQFKLFFSPNAEGISGWLTEDTDDRIFQRLDQIEDQHLTKVQLNQLLSLGHEAPVSDGFFKYFWVEASNEHPYRVAKLPKFKCEWVGTAAICSLDHLEWGLHRLFVDGLLYFGNIRTAYRKLRTMSYAELVAFFSSRRFDTEMIATRGPALPLTQIAKDNRYLISEMACKSYGDRQTPGELKQALLEAYRAHKAGGGGAITVKRLLEGDSAVQRYEARQGEFLFSMDDALEESVSSEEQLEEKYARIANAFFAARDAALANTQFYLSMVNDLDVYVATSMRNRKDFREMADACEAIFTYSPLVSLNIRYFDPTLSAAAGHEDKGLIECLMVKCAKALVYCAGEKESWGKDAEAAMALSLGKPVIFYCSHQTRGRFYREVHPLSRLIEFTTGIAVGAIVTDNLRDVSELLSRIFHNEMEYRLEQPKPGYYRLVETLTNSVVRLQTNDRLLAETFWNHYQNRDSSVLENLSGAMP